MTNESKVVIYGVLGKHLMVFDEADQADRESYSMNRVVTHADYRALEESNAKLDADFWRVTKQNADLMAELAALRALTAELCVARDRLIEAKDRLRKVVSRRKFGSRPQLQENTEEAERGFWFVMESMK